MARGTGFVLLTLVLTVYGQLVIKWRVSRAGEFPEDGSEQIGFVLRLLLDPWIISSMALAVVAALAYFAALAHLDVSRAYLIMSLSFAVVVLAAAPLFGETLTLAKLSGVGLIITGVLIATRL